jgi:hypothetical protein
MKLYIYAMALLGFALLLGGCPSDDEEPSDGGPQDYAVSESTIPLPDGFTLWPCEEPGKACNAHDPCAIDPVCGPDLKCYPTKLQLCDDELDCTENICKGMGLCDFKPKPGFCALPVKVGGTNDAGPATTVNRCFKKEERNPTDDCLLCDPDESPTQWTEANGGACDDGDDCTKDDYCQSGVCKGVFYGTQCQDEYSCTEDICDGIGGCLGHKLKSDYCLINGECYKDNAKHPSGDCLECDVSKSDNSWTPITNTCSIDNVCYGTGDLHTGGCAECDPAVSTTGWTVKGSDCLIDNICKKPGDKDSIGCGVCDPTKDKYGWTPLQGLCKIEGKCYQAGDSHPDGCGECKPTVNATAWTLTSSTQCLIGGQCYNPGDKDALGCSTCELSNPTQWTKIPGCFNIVFAALNEAHDGKLGGLSGANALCAQQAAQGGFSGTFKAFLSTATQDVKDLIPAANASSVAVLNSKGEKLYDSWNQMFSLTKWTNSAVNIYSFDGTEVDEGTVSPDWYDGRAWHGSNVSGTVKTGYTCQDWTSNASSDNGADGELDDGNVYWLSSYYDSCDETVAVICVQTAP